MDAAAITNIIVSVLTLGAILLGPMWALQKQRQLDTEREHQSRQLALFRALLSYRATPVSLPFVQALNLIDVEFDGDTHKCVRDAWKLLLKALNEDMSKAENVERVRNLTIDLLVVMGKNLGYSYDKEYLEHAGYYPLGLTWIEQEQNALRKKLLGLLDGNTRLAVGVFEDKFPEITLPQMAKKAGQ